MAVEEAKKENAHHRRSNLHAFLCFNFILAPVLVLFICVVMGAILALCEGLPFEEGFYFVASSVSGARGIYDSEENNELTVMGEILEIFISVIALTLAGGVVGLAAIMSLSVDFPRELHVNDSVRNAVCTLLVFIPVLVLAFCVVCGGLFAASEGWDFRSGFEYITQTVCNLAANLTPRQPESHGGKTIAVIFAIASLGITSVIVGLVGHMALCEHTIEMLEVQLGRWETVMSDKFWDSKVGQRVASAYTQMKQAGSRGVVKPQPDGDNENEAAENPTMAIMKQAGSRGVVKPKPDGDNENEAAENPTMTKDEFLSKHGRLMRQLGIEVKEPRKDDGDLDFNLDISRTEFELYPGSSAEDSTL